MLAAKGFCLAVFLVVVFPQLLFAQTSVSGGFGFPLVLSPQNSDVAPTVRTALWGEATFSQPSRIVSFYAGVDWSIPYEAEWRRSLRVTGTGTYQHTVFNVGVSFRLQSTERSEITAVASYGMVLMRIDETAQIASGGLASAQIQRTKATRLDPSVLGGINASVNVNERVGFTFRVRVRLTQENEFESFAIVPSAGLRIALSR